MDMAEVERSDLAAFLATLSPEQWAAPGAGAAVAKLERGETVTASRWQVITTDDRRTLPTFSPDVITYRVTSADVVTPAERINAAEMEKRQEPLLLTSYRRNPHTRASFRRTYLQE